MDKFTDIETLKKSIQDFCTARDWDQFHAPKDLAIGLVTEASELLELFRFKSEVECREAMAPASSKRVQVEEELADTFFFVLRFAQLYGIDLSEAFRSKMEKNAKRYPVELAKGSNRKAGELRSSEV